MKIIKRNGTECNFNQYKISNAIKKANKEVPVNLRITEANIDYICSKICKELLTHNSLHVEEIQDIVERHLVATGNYDISKRYILYRYERELKRKGNSTDNTIMSLIQCNNEEIKQENSNKNPIISSVQRDYMAGEVSKDMSRRILIPKDIIDAHDSGVIHFHDMDYFAQNMYNCSLVNLEDMLQNGTVISQTKIDKPHSFTTACNIATQIIAQVASSQYGGQSFSLAHLAPFVQISREKITKDLEDELKLTDIGEISDVDRHIMIERRVREEIKRGVQIIQYQVITLMTTNGQAPFVTAFMYLGECEDPHTKADLAIIIEEILKQRIQGVKNEQGVFISPAFPKLIYVLEEDNIKADSKYHHITELAAKCTAKRLVPDYISEKVMKRDKVDKDGNSNCYPCMGCRSFLTTHVQDSKPKYYGRFNQGVVTLNLPDVALSSKGNLDEFWKILDERLDLCEKALMIRHDRLKGVLSDTAPILWQHGGIARLEPGETIDDLLTGGYSTLSLGYAGLHECCKYMKGATHFHPHVTPFSIEVMQYLNDRCDLWKSKHNIDFSPYGTPLESTTYKFAKTLKNRFGHVNGITNKDYITNSYHVHVTEEVSAFEKLSFESKFQTLSPGGAISYVEVPDMKQNIEAILAIMEHIYENIMYAEINTKSDYCQECSFDGEILIKEVDKKLIWECPSCGCTDQTKMNVARRTCGYIGTQFWNQGRTQEIKDRVLHL